MVITVILSVGCLLMFKAFYVYYTLCPSYMMILLPAAFIINVRLHMSVLLSIHLSAYKYVYMLILTARYCDGVLEWVTKNLIPHCYIDKPVGVILLNRGSSG